MTKKSKQQLVLAETKFGSMVWDPETQTYRKVLSYAEMRKQLRS